MSLKKVQDHCLKDINKWEFLRTIDGEQSQERVLIDILLTLFPYAAYANVPSVFHNHIDAKNKDLVEQINQKITEKMGEKGCKYKYIQLNIYF